jgi:hypothetical protein
VEIPTNSTLFVDQLEKDPLLKRRINPLLLLFESYTHRLGTKKEADYKKLLGSLAIIKQMNNLYLKKDCPKEERREF